MNIIFRKKIFSAILITSLTLLSACASKLSMESPDNIDLSGTWILNTTYSQDVVLDSKNQSRGKEAGPGKGGRGGEGGRGGRGGKDGNGDGERRERPENGKERGKKQKKTLAMTSKEMTITQNKDSIGIAYNVRSRESGTSYRDIEWGQTKYWDKSIEAGWNDKEHLVIQTTNDKSDIIETYQLNAGGRVLTLMIEVNGNEYRRVFERKPESR